MLLYAITSRVLLAETEAERAQKLVQLAAEWAANSIDFIQIRESDLSIPDLTRLAASIVSAVRENSSHTRVLINASPEVATAISLESAADGVHLPGGLNPEQLAAAIARIQKTWQTTGPSPTIPLPTISVSCHSVAEVQAARAAGATLAPFAPVFEKVLPGTAALAGQGLESLAEACHAARQSSPRPALPILALGGVTLENASQCTAAGAAGIAAIRLFLNADKNRDQDWRQLSHRNRDSV